MRSRSSASRPGSHLRPGEVKRLIDLLHRPASSWRCRPSCRRRPLPRRCGSCPRTATSLPSRPAVRQPVRGGRRGPHEPALQHLVLPHPGGTGPHHPPRGGRLRLGPPPGRSAGRGCPREHLAGRHLHLQPALPRAGPGLSGRRQRHHPLHEHDPGGGRPRPQAEHTARLRSRAPDDIIFHRTLAEIAGRHPASPTTSSSPTRRRATGGAPGSCPPTASTDCIGRVGARCSTCAGPKPCTSSASRSLARLGIEPRRVRKEVFGPPRDVTRQPGWPRRPAGRYRLHRHPGGGRSISARAGEPLMNSLEREGIVLPAQCRTGECSLCRTASSPAGCTSPRACC